MFTLMVILCWGSFLAIGEARVYCSDAHSQPYTNTGFSCPLKCENIATAIEYLLFLDYNSIIRPKPDDYDEEGALRNTNHTIHHIASLRKRNFMDNLIKIQKRPKSKAKMRSDLKKYADIFKNKTVIDTVKKELYHMAKMKKIYDNGNCTEFLKFKETDELVKDLYRRCTTRSSFEDGFVARMTAILNSFALTDYKFTEDMTFILLRKILGANIDLRQGEHVVPKIITYLRNAIDYERTKNYYDDNKPVLHLGSRHCMTIYVPGCYCDDGYIEKNGRCVKPEQCVHEQHNRYLNRIIIHYPESKIKEYDSE